MTWKSMLAIAAVALVPALALAHGDAKPLHGGKIVDTGHHHLELVAKDGELILHVRHDDEKPEDVKSAKASATVLSGGKQSSVSFTPGDGGVLTGKGEFTSKGATVVVTLTMPDHKPEQARFKLD